MKLESKYFDSIRVARKQERAKPVREEYPSCQWKGCKAQGRHRAPKGRGRDGEYYFFCLDHVRQYNASYNYFDGMNDAEVEDFQKEELTGHRPTWKVGANADVPGKPQGDKHMQRGHSAGAPLIRMASLRGGQRRRARSRLRRAVSSNRWKGSRSRLLVYREARHGIRLKHDSRNSLSFIIQMRTVGISAPVISCARLSKPITI